MQDRPTRAAIIGVGLLGGSIGFALRKCWPDLPVVGVARRQKTRQAALETGAVSEASDDAVAACRGADLVIVCTPVSRIASAVIDVAKVVAEEALITDVGSTKATMVREIEEDAAARQKFVGSHPIAGSEKSGPENASPELLQGKSVIVTPTEHTDPHRSARVTQLWTRLGASVTTLSPEQHDQIFAATSHVPHLVSAAIASIITPDSLPFVGSGWRDTTRVAAGDPRMWTAICLANADAILESSRHFSQQFARLTDAIHRRDAEQIEAFFRDAKALRDQVD